MKVRWVIAVMVATAGGLGAAVAAGAQEHGTARNSGPPKRQRTHPRVRPHVGGRTTTFEVRFRLRQKPGHRGAVETSYRVEVSPRRNARNSCWPTQPAAVTRGRKGEVVKRSLSPPRRGWCTGRYRVTVFLQRGPYCPPPQNAQPRPCPEFATRELDTGRTHFIVRAASA